MAKRGPKITEIDWVQFDKLCGMQCTAEEIASWFMCSVDTIERAVLREKEMKFADYYSQKRKRGHISLRRAQWQAAVEDKIPSMLIFLGKQFLGQKDNHEIDLSAKDIKIVIDKEDAGL